MLYPAIDPIAFSVGPVSVHWYGLMYVFGLVSAWVLGRKRAAKATSPITPAALEDLLIWGMLGVVLGGRVGYVLFYNFNVFIADPLEIIRLWNGGMSFHGGLCGVVLAVWWWARKQALPFWVVIDFVAPLIPPGLFFGRIGNFINNELWGAPTTLPWGMSISSGGVMRHPSQLYEAGLEGVVMFVCLWIYSSKPRAQGRVAGVFALLYGVFRAAVECVRLPDAHIGYLAFGWLTMGQVLCVPLIALGMWLLLRPASLFAQTTPAAVPAKKQQKKQATVRH